MREFYGIGEQVQDDFAKALFVTDYVWRGIWIYRTGQVQFFCLGTIGYQIQGVFKKSM